MTERTDKESLEKLLDKDEPYFRPTKMQTRKVGMVDCGDHARFFARRQELRSMKSAVWIDHNPPFCSGTLRKNKHLGFRWYQQYLEERVAWEFGWEFECLASSRIRFNDALTEGDSKAITEAGWHMERYITLRPFLEDRFEVKSIEVTYEDESVSEGVGLILRETSARWIPNGHIVFAIVAEWNREKKEWLKAKNPC
jgi:hypothetical protein